MGSTENRNASTIVIRGGQHPIVFILATFGSAEGLIDREPALKPEASILHVERLSRIEIIEILREEGYTGDGLSALAKLTGGDWGATTKALDFLASSRSDKKITREAVEDAACLFRSSEESLFR